MFSEYRHKIIRNFFITLIFALFALMFWPFFTSILLASLFAFALHDILNKITAKKIPKKWASLLLIISIILFIATPSAYIVLKTVSTIKHYAHDGIESTAIYQATVKALQDTTIYITDTAAQFDLDLSKMPQPVELLEKYSGEVGSVVTKIASSLPRIAMSLIVFFLTLYYFLNESHKIKHLFIKFDLLSDVELNKISAVIKKSSYLTLVASILIGNLQAFVVSIFAYFCGFTDFFVVYIITFIFSLIPIIGSAPVSIFLSLISFIEGNTGAGIAMAVAFAIASSLDNLIKPFLLNSNTEDLHPVVSLLALIGSVLIYGPIGILLGPILTSLAFSILPILGSEENTGDIESLEP